MTPIVQLIFNPDSGHYDAATVTRLRAAFERAGARTLLAESSPRVACRIDAAATLVCAIGGDGTLRHVIAALRASGRDVPLAAFACGSVNLYQSEVGCPTEIDAFVAHVLSAPPRAQWDATLNDTRMAICAGVGPDAMAVAAVSTRLKRLIGRFAYVVAFLAVLLRWPRPALRLAWPGGALDCEAVLVAKGRYYAGPWSFAPQAALDDPRLHVLAWPRMSRWHHLRFTLALLTGRPQAIGGGSVAFGCESLTIDADRPWPVQADGDIVAQTPCAIALAATPYHAAR